MDKRFPKKSRLDDKDMVILQMLKNGNPSIDEMREAILVRSTGTVHSRLEFMEEQGLITQPAKLQARSRKITSAGLAKLKEVGLG
jgi:predicted transcriptional regulator